jgi:hypothetical protein
MCVLLCLADSSSTKPPAINDSTNAGALQGALLR